LKATSQFLVIILNTYTDNMKYLLLIIFISFSIAAFSQDNGQSIHTAGQEGRLRLNNPNTDPYTAESNSPFFSDRWMKSTLVLANGKVQNGLTIKLDLFENKIYFLDGAGNENISTTPVREILLADTAGNKMYRLIHSSALKTTGAETGWYQLLCAGDVELYKRTIKALPRSMTQQSDEEAKPLETSVQFFVLIKGNLLKIKKGKDIPELAGEKKAQLQEYARSKNLNGKSEADMIEIVTYYNSLK
jgi:hypothetical protein